MSNDASLLRKLNADLAKQREITEAREAEQRSIETGFQRVKHGMSTSEAIILGGVKGTDRGPENG